MKQIDCTEVCYMERTKFNIKLLGWTERVIVATCSTVKMAALSTEHYIKQAGRRHGSLANSCFAIVISAIRFKHVDLDS